MRRNRPTAIRFRPAILRFEAIGPASILVPMLPLSAAYAPPSTPDQAPPASPPVDPADELDRVFGEPAPIASDRAEADATGWMTDAAPVTDLPQPDLAVASPSPDDQATDSSGASQPTATSQPRSSSGAQPYYSGGSASAPAASTQGVGGGAQPSAAASPAPVDTGAGDGGTTGTGGGTSPSQPTNPSPTSPTDPGGGGSPTNPTTYNLRLNVTASNPVPVAGPSGGGSTMLQGTFTISRSSQDVDYDTALTVHQVYTGTAAQNTDYQVTLSGPNDGTNPVIPANQMSTTVAITVLPNRGRANGAEIDLEALANDTHLAPDGSNAPVSHDGTGKMNVPPTSLVTVVATTPEATEGDPTPGVFTISRTGDRTYALPVTYAVGGSAIAGTDYQGLFGQAVIPAGSASVDVPVVPIGSPSNQGDVTIILSIQASASSYAAGTTSGRSQSSNATVTIYDGISDISISSPQPNASEFGLRGYPAKSSLSCKHLWQRTY